MRKYFFVVALFALSVTHVSYVVTKPASNYRCVKATQCNKPITPNPSAKSGLPADLALYDVNGSPIWTLSFCKASCGDKELMDQIMADYEESSVRQASLVDMNVCCSEKELKPEAKKEVNWSLTKDPKRCKEFGKDGYRCVPEEKCKSGGFDENDYDIEASEWSCDATTGLRTFVENERKKSNGNVCCRSSSVSVRSDDDYEYEGDDYETDDKNNIDHDRESKKTYCSQRSGYRCVSAASCTSEGSNNAFSNAISQRQDSSDEDWEASASCEDPPKEKGNLEAFVRSDSFASVRSGLDRKKRQVDDKVCCKEANIQPSCSDIESTHRCVPRTRCSPPRRRKAEVDGASTAVRSDADFAEIHPSEYTCEAKTGKRSSSDDIKSAVRSDGFDSPNYDAYIYEDYENDDEAVRSDYAYENDYEYDEDHEDELICCDHEDILPTVVREKNLEKCEDKRGFKCVSQDICRNSKIVLGEEDVSAKDQGIIKLGIRVDQFNINQTILNQDGNVCPSVLEVCCKVNDVPESLQRDIKKPPADYTSKCGNRNINGVDVTVNGKEDAKQLTQFGEWPNMCAISTLNAQTGRKTYLGGASLITAGIVVTAAHKVLDRPKEDITVRCGDWDARNINEPRPYQDRSIESVSVHPSFDSTNVYNDVALLHVNEPFQFDKHIDRVCLPPPFDRFSYLPRGCKATGWGKDKYEGGSYQVLMAQVELPIVDNRRCQDNLRKFTALSDSFKLDDSFLCAGGKGGVDTCVGDGGGPLMCPAADGSGQWIQAGITAWGIGCGEENVPGVYASLTEAVCFIDWMTKCKHGDKYLDEYDFSKECNTNEGTWIEQEIIRLEDILDKTEFHLQRSSLTSVQRKRYLKRRDNTRKFLMKAQDMEAECSAERGEGLDASDLNNESSAQVRGDEEYYDEYGYDEYGSYSSRD